MSGGAADAYSMLSGVETTRVHDNTSILAPAGGGGASGVTTVVGCRKSNLDHLEMAYAKQVGTYNDLAGSKDTSVMIKSFQFEICSVQTMTFCFRKRRLVARRSRDFRISLQRGCGP